jgi:hypothetical protein
VDKSRLSELRIKFIARRIRNLIIKARGLDVRHIGSAGEPNDFKAKLIMLGTKGSSERGT